MSPKLVGNPVDLGSLMAVSNDTFFFLQEAMAAVFADTNTDCVAIIFHGGNTIITSAVMDLLDQLRQHISKPVSIWIHGTDWLAGGDIARQLEVRGLPAYFYLEIAIKALGIAAYYSQVRLSLDKKAV